MRLQLVVVPWAFEKCQQTPVVRSPNEFFRTQPQPGQDLAWSVLPVRGLLSTGHAHFLSAETESLRLPPGLPAEIQ
jgi:hypothetical protein